MTASPPPEKDSRAWLIWLALGVLLALVGPTWLFNWKFNPSKETSKPTPPPQEEPVAPPDTTN